MFLSDGDEGSVGVQSIKSMSSSSIRSSVRSDTDFGGPEEVGGSRDGRPKIGFDGVATTGVDDNESAARRSGSVAGLGVGDERVLVPGEGVGLDENL